MTFKQKLMKLLGIKQKPEVAVMCGEIGAMSPYIVKARGGKHGYDWEQITINSHHFTTARAYARAAEYAEETGATLICE
jgi:hypothetical protein